MTQLESSGPLHTIFVIGQVATKSWTRLNEPRERRRAEC